MSDYKCESCDCLHVSSTRTVLLAGGDIYAIEIAGNTLRVYDKRGRPALIETTLTADERRQLIAALQEQGEEHEQPEAISNR